ncbi:hypothetical protein EOPP23_05180 [Endozoicomonas sp. OPT23]|uniref:hypothetical protein n=1 Tax=Endozoicomonas sp. OPT23 TaxID=2072845 RepID=UPI00129A4E16|nr:hypothetical protein [Endozoicomonas sp. OPT23]MRI32375.1 hypothetical protein [Endozoicomonas sp. OPT23]
MLPYLSLIPTLTLALVILIPSTARSHDEADGEFIPASQSMESDNHEDSDRESEETSDSQNSIPDDVDPDEIEDVGQEDE